MYFISKYVTENLDLSISIYAIVHVNLSRFYQKYVIVFKQCVGITKLEHLYSVVESNADTYRENDWWCNRGGYEDKMGQSIQEWTK